MQNSLPLIAAQCLAACKRIMNLNRYSMRVLCINDKWAGPPVEEGLPSPQIGDKDDVTGTVEFLGENYYILAAYGNNRGFMCRHFVAIPDQTADEIEAETKEAIVNLETVLP